MKIIVLFALVLVLICGCVTTLPVPTASDAERGRNRWNDVTVAQLENGRALYKSTCGSCHQLHSPSEYTLAKWDTIIPVMQRKAKITQSQADEIYRYIAIMRDTTYQF